MLFLNLKTKRRISNQDEGISPYVNLEVESQNLLYSYCTLYWWIIFIFKRRIIQILKKIPNVCNCRETMIITLRKWTCSLGSL